MSSPFLFEPSHPWTFVHHTPSAAPAEKHATSTSPQKPRSPRSRLANHVSRPRNAFIIFRSELWAQQKISGTIERDHRHISRIIGHCWRGLSEAEKQVWRNKAEAEKVEHRMNNPDYKFVPVARANRPAKRNVKRNGTDELNRCRRVAELLLQGKQGDELETAVKIIDGTGAGTPCRQPAEATPNLPAQPAETSSEFFDWPTAAEISDGCTVPAFRSPLLPPQTVLPSSLNCSAVENMTEMQPFDCNPSPSAPTYPELQSEMYNLWTAPTVPDDMWPLFLQGDPPLYDPFSQYMLGLEFSVFNTDVSPALATNFMQLNPRFV